MGNPWKAFKDFFRTGRDRPPGTRDPEVVRRTYESHRWSVFLSATLGYGLYYVCRINFSVVKKPMLDEGILDATQMGLIGSALLMGYAAGKLVNGFLADRSNIRRFMSIGLLASAAINVFLGFGPGFTLFLAAWGLNGWFQSIGAPGSIVTMSHWFSPKERGSRYGVWCISHNIGEGLTFVLTAFMVSSLGWRWGFWGPALLCIGAGLILYRTLADRPQTLGLPPVTEYKDDPAPIDKAEASVGRLQREVLRNPAVWILGFSSAMMYVARYGVNNWGVLVLQEGKGHSMMDAGTILAVYSVAGLSGSFLSGIISDRFFGARRNLPAFLFGLLQIASLTALFLIPPGEFWLDTAALAVFGFAMGILVSFLGGLMAIDIVSPRAAGAAAGVVGMFSYIGAALQDAASGWMINQGRTVVETPTSISMERVSNLLGTFGTDLSLLIGPQQCVGIRTVMTRRVDYSFTDPFIFWIGASVLSLLLALAVWKAVDRARGRV